MEKVETAKQLWVGIKTTAPCKKVMPLFDNMTDFNGWAIVIQAHSHQFLAGFLLLFAEKEFVRATPKPASSMAHSTVTRALALWAHT